MSVGRPTSSCHTTTANSSPGYAIICHRLQQMPHVQNLLVSCHMPLDCACGRCHLSVPHRTTYACSWPYGAKQSRATSRVCSLIPCPEGQQGSHRGACCTCMLCHAVQRALPPIGLILLLPQRCPMPESVSPASLSRPSATRHVEAMCDGVRPAMASWSSYLPASM